MKTAGDKVRSRSKRAPVDSENQVGAGGESNPEHVATAAYYKAQARGFSPGLEMEDWLSAEAELTRRPG